MQRPLDPLGFKQNRYARPNQAWICGRAAEGRACPLGPDKDGNCRATGQCSPAGNGVRWTCTRSEAEGGKCAEGPLPRGECAHLIPPCQPVRSLRRRRGRLVWTVAALTTGLLVLGLGTSLRRPVLDPGELTRAHATLAQKCQDCHSLEPAGPLALAAFKSPQKRALADSALCLKCHSLGDQPLNSHGAAPASLLALERKLPPHDGSTQGPLLLGVSRNLSGLDAHAGEMACSTCHQEHQGRDFDLKRLSNTQCQTCHAVQFASLANGHPEFSAYPYQRRTRIFFDHNSHLRQHFAEMKDKALGSCQDCHVTDQAGRFMQVKSFAATCAACHAPQIQGEGMTVKGLSFFTVPGLDVDTLAARGISIGEWPKFADGKITPFMELLLDREPATREAWEKLRGVDLLDLSRATPDQLAAAGQLAWGVKDLLCHLVSEGPAVLSKPGQPQPAGLAGGLSRAVVLAAQREWLPNLFTEVAKYRRGIKPPLPAAVQPAPPPASTPVPQKSPGGDESLLGGDDLAPKSTPAAKDKTLPASEPKPAEDDLLGGDAPKPTAAAAPPAATPAATPIEPAPPEDWMAAGGWYRPEGSLTIFYRPTGHADAFLTAWLTTSAAQAPGVFAQLADPQSPGVCLKCHTADRADQAGNTLTVNWRPALTEPGAHPFTTFQHTAHFSLTGDNGCQTCHVLNPKSDYAKYFIAGADAGVNREANHFESNFKPLAKATCLECHQPNNAGDGCLQCHQYHTGSFDPNLGKGF